MNTKDSGYRTRQRALVLDYLKEINDCVTADDILCELTRRGHAISKATVYRCLEHFVSEGAILRFTTGDNTPASYRCNLDHDTHFHLRCLHCGTTICVDCSFIDHIGEHFYEHHQFEVDPAQTVFYGTCSKCRNTHLPNKFC